MDMFNVYIENFPSIKYIFLSTIPTITYFVSVNFYLKFHKKIKLPDKKYIQNSSKNMISSSFANVFLSYPLFSYFSEIESISFFMIVMGCLLIDTIEYWFHYLFHFNKFLYNRLHYGHHSPFPLNPRVSFANEDVEVLITSPTILMFMILFKFTYLEYIIVTSLAFCATVCDHTFTSSNKFHVLHHNGDKNTNLQQPFFTFWDHLNGTYNKKTLIKIPFVP